MNDNELRPYAREARLGSLSADPGFYDVEPADAAERFGGDGRYQSIKADPTPVVMGIRDLARTRMRYGYFRFYILLRREGWTVNHKRVHRLYREDGLSLRLRRPRRHVTAARRERQNQ